MIGRGRPGGPIQQRHEAFGRALAHVLFGVIPVVVTLILIAFESRLNALALDLRVAYWPAGVRLLHGASPYAISPQEIANGWSFVYPALSALLLAPLALVSNGAAQVLWTLVCLACIPAILYALGVTDWRVYGLVMLWSPVFDGWLSGNLTLPLALAVALTWRYRDRPIVAGLLTAGAISAKVFVWPLGLWLLATRRWRAALWALVGGLAINLLAWGVVGFSEINVYLRLSSDVTKALWKGGYSVMAVAHHFGADRATGEVLLVAVSAVAAAALIYVGFARRRERDAFVLMVLLMLLATPLLWSHYFSLLLIPLALALPRLNVAWGVGLLMWPMPPRQPVFAWEEVLAWGVTAVCVRIAMSGASRPATRVQHAEGLRQNLLQTPEARG